MVLSTSKVFQIREWVEFDSKGRANCPCCAKGAKDKTLSLVPNTEYGYKCFRGCTPAEIRAALDAPTPGQHHGDNFPTPTKRQLTPTPPPLPCTVPERKVKQSVKRLLVRQGKPQEQALAWLESRGITKEMIAKYRIGLEQRLITPDESKPWSRECYWSIALFIPCPDQPGHFYVKKRVAPWLTGDKRPDYLPPWSQYGVKRTIYFTHNPPHATRTFFCEGEWDAICLGWLASQRGEQVAIACSTSGCSSTPSPEQLALLPGEVLIFYDRNDKPKSDGTRAGEEGALKMALALAGRGRIAQVPMPDGCTKPGWDVSDALNAGYTWSDFEKAASAAVDVELTSATKENGNGGNGTPERQTFVAMRERLIELLNRALTPSAQTEALNELSLSSGWSVREIRTLVDDLESDLDKTASRSERDSELKELESYKQLSLTLNKYLPPSIAEPITRVANWMEAPTAAFLVPLLAAIASCCDPRTRVIVKESINFIEPAIIYGGIVTESGQRKSPILNAILDGIKELQAEEDARYRTEKANYEAEYQSWMAKKDSMTEEEWKNAQPTPPVPLREFFIDKATVEAIDKIKGEQPDTAFLWIKDELSGLFGSYGAYKKGKGEDKESVLSSWNGRGIKKNLKGGERVSIPYDAMSIIGAIQEATLQKLMGNFDDNQGEWGRFLWALIPLKALRLPEHDTLFQLVFLKSLYQKARALEPQKYRFAFDAQALYDNYHWKLEQRRVAHSQPGMRAAISKMEGYTARLALVLHLIWELEAGNTTPSLYIPRERVEAAIELAEFFLSQVTLIHSEGAAALGEGGLTPRLSAILNKLHQFGELTARKLQAAISWLRKEKPRKIRDYLIELAKLGYGKLVGQGNRLKLVLTADSADPTADSSADSSAPAQTIDLREIESPLPQTADSADRGNSSGANQKNNGHDVHHVEQMNGDIELAEMADDYQQDQHINTLPSKPEKSSTLTADELSTEPSAVDKDDDPDDHLPSPSEGSQVPSPSNNSPDGNGSAAATPSRNDNDSLGQSAVPSGRGNQLAFLSMVLEMKVFTHLVGSTLQVSSTAREPDLVTPLENCQGYKALATMLLRCETPEALAVLRSVFPRTLLCESLTCISHYQEQLKRLKALSGGVLPTEPVYVYFGDTEVRGDIRAGSSGRDRVGYLKLGTLVVEQIPPHSIPELAYVQIVGNPDSSFQVRRDDLWDVIRSH